MRSFERHGEHCWLEFEVEKAGKQRTVIGELQLTTTRFDATEFADSEAAVVVDPTDQQLCGALHCAGGQRYIDGHCTAFELEAEDGIIVGAPGWARASLAEHIGAGLKESNVVAVPQQVRYRGQIQHRENVGLIALQAGHRQIVRAVDEGPRLKEEL